MELGKGGVRFVRSGNRTVAEGEGSKHSVAPSLGDKLKDPEQFPVLTVQEAAQALRLSRATIYRMMENGSPKRASLGADYGTRRAARVTTKSVIAALGPES